MSFNRDPSKQAQEIFLVEKLRRFLVLHYVLMTALFRKPYIKKHLGMFLDAQLLTFEEHFKHLKVITTKQASN